MIDLKTQKNQKTQKARNTQKNQIAQKTQQTRLNRLEIRHSAEKLHVPYTLRLGAPPNFVQFH